MGVHYPPPPVEVAAAVDRFVAGNVEGALSVLRGLEQADGVHPDVLYVASMCERSRGRLEAAAMDLTRAIEARPGHAPYVLEWGLLQLQNGEREAGLETLREAVRLADGDAEARVELYVENAAVLHQNRCSDLAILSLQKALKFGPDVRAYRLLARILVTQKRWAEAVHTMTEALAHYPHDVRLIAAQALALAQGGRNTQAIPLFEKALAADTEGDAFLRYNLARCYESVGDAERAAILLAEAKAMGLPEGLI